MTRLLRAANQHPGQELDPPATLAERVHARNERRRVIRKSVATGFGLLGVLGVGVALSHVFGTHHTVWFRAFWASFAAIFIGAMTFARVWRSPSEAMHIFMKRNADAAEAQKQEFLAALDE
jgi:hypothetical protein